MKPIEGKTKKNPMQNKNNVIKTFGKQIIRAKATSGIQSRKIFGMGCGESKGKMGWG